MSVLCVCDVVLHAFLGERAFLCDIPLFPFVALFSRAMFRPNECGFKSNACRPD